MMDHGDRHTVSAFDRDLDDLRGLVAQMAARADAAIGKAMDALARQDVEAAERVVARDSEVNALQIEIERRTVRLIALRAPMADDLREALAALKIASIVERIADYGKNIARRVRMVGDVAALDTGGLLPRMAASAKQMFRDAIASFSAHDASAAREIHDHDEEVDDLHRELLLALIAQMMKDPQTVRAATALMSVAKSLERIGDHAASIAENVYFAVTGEQLSDERGLGAGPND